SVCVISWSVDWKRSELKLGTTCPDDSGNEAIAGAAPNSLDSPAICASASAAGVTGASVKATNEGGACAVTTGAGRAGIEATGAGVAAVFLASGSSHEGIFTSSSCREAAGRCFPPGDVNSTRADAFAASAATGVTETTGGSALAISKTFAPASDRAVASTT